MYDSMTWQDDMTIWHDNDDVMTWHNDRRSSIYGKGKKVETKIVVGGGGGVKTLSLVTGW